MDFNPVQELVFTLQGCGSGWLVSELVEEIKRLRLDGDPVIARLIREALV